MDIRKLKHLELLSRQKSLSDKSKKLPIIGVLDNIRSAHNVGSIFRTSDGAGLEKLWLCGITSYPPNTKLTKTALDSQDHVDWQYQSSIIDVVTDLKNKGYQIVVLEQTTKSCSYEQFAPKFPACLIVGNETDGVSQEVLPLCDAAIEIPMQGVKNSMNVSVAFGIIVYQWRVGIMGL